MNFLAHIYLAGHSREAMLGALLGDFVKAGYAGELTPEIQLEIQLHRKIDRYTDNHETVVNARALFSAGKRRFAGILLDVFYDHVLAKHWSSYCPIPLSYFVQTFYAHLWERRAVWPDSLAGIAPNMIQNDWLGSYQNFANAVGAIHGIARRLSRNGDILVSGIRDLETHYAHLEQGFQVLFPDLIAFAQEERARLIKMQGFS